MNRRAFIGTTMAATAASTLFGALKGRAEDKPAETVPPAPKAFARKIKLGVVGLGGRGQNLAQLCRQRGGYEVHAVADYFPHVAETQGKALGVDTSRRFSGLSGYQKVIESGVEAIVIIDVPYFYAEQAQAAVAAGLHVYMAKPVAVDVPGALSIGESGKLATQKQRVFLVDYQIPTNPFNAEVTRRIAAGAIGPLQAIFSNGANGGAGWSDPPLTKNIESRLQRLIWCNDNALGGGYHVNYDIHIVDGVLRALRRLPVAANGWSARFRQAPHGDSMDTTCLMFEFADGMVWNHQSVKGTSDDWFLSNGTLAAGFQGGAASARISYWGKAYVRGGGQHYGGGKVADLYKTGIHHNIAAFYDNVTQDKFTNETVTNAVDSALVCMLGREAAARRTRLTMEELLKENKRLEVDLTGLKA